MALTINLHLPSWMEMAVKVSELFQRINSSDSRWAVMGRHVLREILSSVTDADSPLSRPNSGTRLSRAAYLAVKKLHWSIHLNPPQRAVGGRHQHLFDAISLHSAPHRSMYSCASHVSLRTTDLSLPQDLWSGWGTDSPTQTVAVYTDGSYSASSSTSAWSVAVANRWLLEHFREVPTDEHQLRSSHNIITHTALLGASISQTQGIYPAELQAIARAMAMFPLSYHLHIHSDSKASIAAITTFREQRNERKRLRMSARPLLYLINSLCPRRLAAGGSLELHHVAAHSRDSDIDSVGNRIADYQASLSRASPATPTCTPSRLQELPLEKCEPFLHLKSQSQLIIIDDIRRFALSSLREARLVKWMSKIDQGSFAGPGMIELGSYHTDAWLEPTAAYFTAHCNELNPFSLGQTISARFDTRTSPV